MNIVLKSALDAALIHKSRMVAAREKIAHFFPVNHESLVNLTLEDLAYIELYTSRLAKLQDLMGTKIFAGILEEIEDEVSIDSMTYVDKLNKLEKLNVIESADEWKNMRKIRSHVAHEYPDKPDLIARHLNEIYNIYPKLLNYLERIIIFTENKL